MIYYLCAYLFIALMCRCFVRWSDNDKFTNDLLSCIWPLAIILYGVGFMIRKLENKWIPVIATLIALAIQGAFYRWQYDERWQKESARIEQNVWMQVKTMCDKHSIPKGMKAPVPELTLAEDGKAVGYWCKRAGKQK